MLALRAHYAHSACVSKKSDKSSTNLTLSKDAKRMGRALEKMMNRPSLTNVVEALIAEKHAELFKKTA